MIEFNNAFSGLSEYAIINAICNDSNPIPTVGDTDLNTILSK